MRLWTIQKEEVWEQLQRDKVFTCAEKLADEDCKHGYSWMVEQMQEQLTTKASQNSIPLWAWLQSEDGGKPNIKRAGHFEPGTKGVCIEFEIAEDQILLSDFELWHFILYRDYLPASEKDHLLFEKKDLPEKDMINLVKQSWKRIFDLSWHEPYVNQPYEDRIIQGTFWELHLDSVINVEHFIAPEY